MASVVVIYALRQLLSATALKAYGLLIALGALFSMVSVGSVVSNLLGVGVSGAGHFIAYALTHTAGVVQLFTFVGFVFAALLVRDLIRSAQRTQTFA
jgi:hypothetical protein